MYSTYASTCASTYASTYRKMFCAVEINHQQSIVVVDSFWLTLQSVINEQMHGRFLVGIVDPIPPIPFFDLISFDLISSHSGQLVYPSKHWCESTAAGTGIATATATATARVVINVCSGLDEPTPRNIRNSK